MLVDFLLLKILPNAPYVLAKQILARTSPNSETLSILDIGGGSGVYWREVQRLVGTARQLDVVILDGVEISSSADPSKWKRVVGELPSALIDIEDNSFDFVTAFEVIEHLPKHDGYSMLYEMERIARSGYGISTPNNFLWQPPSLNNPLNSHISEWKYDDFRRFGMQSIFLHSPHYLAWVLIIAARVFRVSKLLAAFKICSGLSAWRWNMRPRVEQPLIAPN